MKSYPNGCFTVDFFILRSVWMTLEIKVLRTPNASKRVMYDRPMIAAREQF